MIDSQPQRRPFQFSLRKLMLWTVVLAVCLSAQRLVLVCLTFFRIPNPQFVAVCLAIYLVILVPIRIIWGAERGARIAIFGTFFILALAVEIDLVGSGYGIADAVFVLIPVFVIGLSLSAFGFVFVHILVVAVERMDSLFQRKQSHDP